MRLLELPLVWTAIFLALALVLDRFLPLVSYDLPANKLVGWVVLLLGLGLVAFSAFWFRRKETTIHPGGKPTQLIVEGPFRLSRNPIYLGMGLVILAVALWLGSLSPLLCVPLFIWLITKRFILREEAELRRNFGPAAESYLAGTRRWI